MEDSTMSSNYPERLYCKAHITLIWEINTAHEDIDPEKIPPVESLADLFRTEIQKDMEEQFDAPEIENSEAFVDVYVETVPFDSEPLEF
jgi:hypothetical protein